MTGAGVVVLLVGAAVLAWPPGRAVTVRRFRAVTAGGPPDRTVRRRSGASPAGPVRRWLLAAAAGGALTVLLGGPGGLVVGAGVAVGAERVLRRVGDDRRGTRAAFAGDVPVACDLLAVCLSAGVPIGSALAAVGDAVGGPVGTGLARVAGLHRLGAEPHRAWADAPGELAAMGRVVVRAGESGARAVPALQALAADGRATARAGTEAAVRRAGVWVLAPLGACFLPAFLCLGVVPLVLGIAGEVFG